MFENVNLTYFEFRRTLRSEEMFQEDFVRRYHLEEVDVRRFAEMQQVQNVSCAFSGIMENATLPPASEYAREHLYYPISFGLFSSEKEYYTRRQNYNAYLLLYTYRGQGYLEYEGKTYVLGEGDGVFLDCRKPHYYYTAQAVWQHSYLHFNGANTAEVYRLFAEQGRVSFHFPIQVAYQQNLEKLLETCQQSAPYRELMVSRCIDDMLTDLLTQSAASRHMSETEVSIRELMSYMEQHFSEPVTLDTLSARTHFSKGYLCKSFKAVTGYSPVDYLIRLRIDQACILLLSTTLSISSIGQIVGMESTNNFISQFRRVTGTTPAAYRKKCRN